LPMIMGREKLAVVAGFTFVVHLLRQRHPVRLMTETLFFAIRTHHDATRTIEADMNVVHHDVATVDVPHQANVNVEHRAVVEEGPASPLSAFEAHSAVSEAVVDPTVEADMRPPISAVPAVPAVLEAPISRRPEHAHGRNHPRSGNPIVAAVFIPRPVAGRPKIARARTNRLLIYRKCRRSDAYRNAD